MGSLRSPAPTRRARHLARVSGSTAHTLNAGGESSDVTVQTWNTAPELRLRRILCSRGLRYRVHRRPLSDLARQADIAFTGAKVAVFVDGCVWHGCPEHGRREHRTNGWYWPRKIAANKDRDRDTDERLPAAGCEPIRIWEHEGPEVAADRVIAFVRA